MKQADFIELIANSENSWRLASCEQQVRLLMERLEMVSYGDLHNATTVENGRQQAFVLQHTQHENLARLEVLEVAWHGYKKIIPVLRESNERCL